MTNEWHYQGLREGEHCSCLSHRVHVCHTVCGLGQGQGERRVWVVLPSVCLEVTQLVMAPSPLTLTYMMELVDEPRAPMSICAV